MTFMKLKELSEVLGAENLYCSRKMLETQMATAAASDLMSDILARAEVPDLLLTRLSNSQAIHTASIFGIQCVVVVRNRAVEQTVVELAEEEGIALLRASLSLFESCGILYRHGIRSVAIAPKE